MDTSISSITSISDTLIPIFENDIQENRVKLKDNFKQQFNIIRHFLKNVDIEDNVDKLNDSGLSNFFKKNNLNNSVEVYKDSVDNHNISIDCKNTTSSNQIFIRAFKSISNWLLEKTLNIFQSLMHIIDKHFFSSTLPPRDSLLRLEDYS